MSATKKAVKSTDELLEELDRLMHAKKYSAVDAMLDAHPALIKDLTPKCEVPLVMAIKCWDNELVGICMRHGANPKEKHHCSKDRKDKIPILIAFEEFSKRIRKLKTKQGWKKNFRIYTEILREMSSTDSPA